MKNGGPAFPVECYFSDGKPTEGAQTGPASGWATGMSLRDYFAIHARLDGEGFTSDRHEAERRYEFADAMLAERSKP